VSAKRYGSIFAASASQDCWAPRERGEQRSFDAKDVNVGPNLGPATFCDFIVTLEGATAGPT
jgi:hypothetical protein